MNTSRRHFLKSTAALGAAAAFPTIIPASALGKDGHVAPSSRATVGVLGCGYRSKWAGSYLDLPNAELIAACDPIRERREGRAGQWNPKYVYSDFRELLANPEIDAVHIVTGDHWHVPLALAAARAGKDMYCEKPLGLTIEQDLAAREITREHNRIFQYGTQQRSQTHMRKGIELVLNGHIGEVKEVFAWAPQGESVGSPTPELPVPDGYDLELWTGPAPMRPFCHDRNLQQGPRNAIFHVYDYAIGFMAGWGAHPVDILQWWADQAGMGIPVEYKGTGTVPTEGLFNTVTHWEIEGTYADGTPMVFMDTETANRSKHLAPYIDRVITFGNGTLFVGTKGWVGLSRQRWEVSSEEIRLKARDPGDILLPVSEHHTANFIDGVLARKEPVSTLDSAARSDIICQIGDICVRTGETLRWDPAKETVVGSTEAVKMMHRPMRAPWTL